METVFQTAGLFNAGMPIDNAAVLEAEFAECGTTVAQASTMNAPEKRALLHSLGVTKLQLPLFLRALQEVIGQSSLPKANPNTCRPAAAVALSANAWCPYNDYRAYSLGQYHSASAAAAAAPTPSRSKESYSVTKRDTCGAVGLMNQGATCYLNSLLQVLFHLPVFRKTIYKMPIDETSAASASASADGSTRREAPEADDDREAAAATRDDEDSNETSKKSTEASAVPSAAATTKEEDKAKSTAIPRALQRLFVQLETQDQPCSTNDLTTSFGWSQREAFIQQDVQELTGLLLDNLEQKMIRARMPNIVEELFRGEMKNFFRVPEADYESGSPEGVRSVGIVVKNCNNIYDSLRKCFMVETLDGDNKYCLERNGKKEYFAAQHGTELSKVPPILLMHVNRFDIDYASGTVSKVLSRWEFYEKLDLAPFLPPTAPKDHHEYKLHGVICHSGADINSGHYYCYIRVNGQWLKFNDEVVEPATAAQVFGSNFGGDELNYWGSSSPQTVAGSMLVYIRASMYDQITAKLAPEDIPQQLVAVIEAEREEEIRRQREKAEDQHKFSVRIVDRSSIQDRPELLFNSYFRTEPTTADQARVTKGLSLNDIAEVVENKLPWLGVVGSSPQDGAASATATAAAKHNDPQQGDEDGGGGCVSNIPLPRMDSCLFFTHAVMDTVGPSPSPYRVMRPIDPKTSLATQSAFQGGWAPVTLYAIPVRGDHVEGKPPKVGPSVDYTAEILTNPSITLTHHKWYSALDNNGAGQLTFVASILSTVACTPNALKNRFLKLLFRHLPQYKDTNMQASDVYVELESAPNMISEISTALPIGSGDVYVWQRRMTPPEGVPCRFPTAYLFTRFLRHKCTFKLHLNAFRKGNPLLCELECADDASYEDVQKLVAAALARGGSSASSFGPTPPLSPAVQPPALDDDNTTTANNNVLGSNNGSSAVMVNYECIRFARHNPESGGPHAVRSKVKDGLRLHSLLASNGVTTNILYYEILPFTVAEAEKKNLLLFEFFDELVKPVSAHYILLPPAGKFKVSDIFDQAREIVPALKRLMTSRKQKKKDKKKDTVIEGKSTAVNHVSSSDDTSERPKEEEATYSSSSEDSDKDADDNEEQTAPSNTPPLRLCDTWRGRMFRVYEDPSATFTETFDDSADYRIELAPRPPVDAGQGQYENDADHRTDVSHCWTPQGSTTLKCHGDPFTIFLTKDMKLPNFQEVVARKLRLGVDTIKHWRVQLLGNSQLAAVAVNDEASIMDQLKAYRQKSKNNAGFIGLEHAPLSGTRDGAQRGEPVRGIHIRN